MLKDVKEVFIRSTATIAEDTLGVAALFILLLAGLNLSAFV